MRCDVCDTKIMIGQKECPNCGMKIKDNYVNTFDASGKDHNHIKVEPKKSVNTKTSQTKKVNNEDLSKVFKGLKKNVDETVKRQQSTSRKSMPNSNMNAYLKFFLIFVAINMIGSCIGIIGTVTSGVISGVGEFFEDVDYLFESQYTSLEELRDEEGYIEAEYLIDLRESDIDMMNQYFDEVYVDENIYVEEDVISTVTITGEKDGVCYAVESMYFNDVIDEKTLKVYWSSDTFKSDIKFPYDDEMIKNIGSELGIDIPVSHFSTKYRKFLNENIYLGDDINYEMINEEVIDYDGYDVIMELNTENEQFDFSLSFATY